MAGKNIRQGIIGYGIYSYFSKALMNFSGFLLPIKAIYIHKNHRPGF